MLGVPSVVVLVHVPPHVTLALASDFGYMRLEIQQPASARQLRALIARCASRRFLLDVRALSGGPVPAQKQIGTSTRTWLAELLGEFEREVRCAAGGGYDGARLATRPRRRPVASVCGHCAARTHAGGGD